MNFFQLILLYLTDYTQDAIMSAVVLKYREVSGSSISTATVRNRLNQPISEYKNFTEYFNDTLGAVIGADIRAAIEKKLKETEVV